MQFVKSPIGWFLFFCIAAFVWLAVGDHKRLLRIASVNERREYVLECREEYSNGTTTARKINDAPVSRAVALLPEIVSVFTVIDVRRYLAGTGPRPEIPCLQRLKMLGEL